MNEELLRVHGDTQVRPGEVDFAVNVHGTRPPEWLARRLRARIEDLAAYPTDADDLRARRAAARRHGTDPERVLPLAGSAEGFHLLAEYAARRGLRAAVVHPSFTEPEVELRRAVVDEAFCDVVDDEAAVSLAGADLPGLVVLRSVTKTWALAGLRAGYAVGDPVVLADLAAHRVHWPLGTLQLEAVAACCSDEAAAHLEVIRAGIRADRAAMVGLLAEVGIEIAVPPSAPFVLVRTLAGLDPAEFRERLRGEGYAVRRCDTFPGLDPAHVRLAVRDAGTVRGLVAAWRRVSRGQAG